jgi:hypothetical protein
MQFKELFKSWRWAQLGLWSVPSMPLCGWNSIGLGRLFFAFVLVVLSHRVC